MVNHHSSDVVCGFIYQDAQKALEEAMVISEYNLQKRYINKNSAIAGAMRAKQAQHNKERPHNSSFPSIEGQSPTCPSFATACVDRQEEVMA
jgi:hypothetical protein